MPRNRRIHIKKKPHFQDDHHYRQHILAFNSKLGSYGLRIREIYADGNCLFRSIADQIEGSQDNYKFYRQLAVDHIYSRKAFYQEFHHGNLSSYLNTMNNDGEWGGHLEIQAISEALNVPIFVHSIDSIVVIGQTKQPLRRRNRVQSCLGLIMVRVRTLLEKVKILRKPINIDSLQAINIAYHSGPNLVEHYSSIRLKYDETNKQAVPVPRDIIEIMLSSNNQKVVNGWND